jgi:hypothetical protein
MAVEHATGCPRQQSTTAFESSAARACGDSVLIILEILAAWTVVSIISGFAVAPALSRRLRDSNFPPDDE